MWQQINSNKRKTVIFVTIMFIVFATFMGAIGLYIMGDALIGVAFGVIVWIIMCLVSYFKGDSIFLSSAGAFKITKEDAPVLYDVVEEMKVASGLPKMPDIYIIDEDAPNAFATGRSPEKASVAVTRGLLVKLNRQELQGVIAHEMAHIANSDILVMLFTGTLLGTIVLISDALLRSRISTRSSRGGRGSEFIIIMYLLALILGPICAQFIYLAISRKREYLADACAAQFTRYPMGLANALMKISSNAEEMKSANSVTAAMYIVNPLKFDKVKKKLSDLSSTHPSTSERIKILTKMANIDFESYEKAFKAITHKSNSPVTKKMAQGVSWAVPLAAISTAMPVEDTPEIKIQKHRQTENIMWKYNDYVFVECECGTKLKVPPEYKGREIKCPHCKKVHSVQ